MYNTGRNNQTPPANQELQSAAPLCPGQNDPYNPESAFLSITGVITSISNQTEDGCSQRFQLKSEDGNITNFIVTPQTYFINHQKAAIGMTMTAFYDSNLPVPLIYPPQYNAVAGNLTNKNVKISQFNQNLVSQDGSLRINISPQTMVILPNGQEFRGNIRNRTLIVVYGASTRSIPAQTTPEQVIVIC